MDTFDEKILADWYLRAHRGDSVKAAAAAAIDLEHSPANCVLQEAYQILLEKAGRKEQIAFPEPAAGTAGGENP